MKVSCKPSNQIGLCISLGMLSGTMAAWSTGTHLPRFGDYPAGPIYRGRTHPLLSKYRDAASKTGIPDAPQRTADFAGHYILVTGSCGTGCQGLNVMDARTGEIYDFKYAIVETHPSNTLRIRYRLTSNLLILHGELDEKEETYGTYYYLFKANHFVRLRYIHSKPQPMPVP